MNNNIICKYLAEPLDKQNTGSGYCCYPIIIKNGKIITEKIVTLYWQQNNQPENTTLCFKGIDKLSAIRHAKEAIEPVLDEIE